MKKGIFAKIILWALIVLVVLCLGYYLRAYHDIHHDLAKAPYAALGEREAGGDFRDKTENYQTGVFLKELFDPIFRDVYIVYLLGALVIFFLGKEISGKNTGGFLALCAYAVAGENLLQYMSGTGRTGFCYLLILSSLLFFLKYMKSRKTAHICSFAIFSLLAMTTYHTGATAMILIIIGLFFSMLFSKSYFKIDKKIVLCFSGIIIFYVFWLALFDSSQIRLIKNALIIFVRNWKSVKMTFILAIALVILLVIKALSSKNKKSLEKFLNSSYMPLIALFLSAILIFCKANIFGFLLKLGVKHYYISSVTLNNYIAQALLLHVYALMLLPAIFKRKLGSNLIFLRGWLIGLALIFVGLYAEGYLARIFDYSFPLMFILFGLFWSNKIEGKEKKVLGTAIIILTLLLFIASQLIIYNDSFSMRRYYNQNEIDSVSSIISLNLTGTIASDLRTAALFGYLGNDNVTFGKEGGKLHEGLFYDFPSPQNFSSLSKLNLSYVILSENMRYIVHATSFPTKPIDNKTFEYYSNNFQKVYDDKLMYVYDVRI